MGRDQCVAVARSLGFGAGQDAQVDALVKKFSDSKGNGEVDTAKFIRFLRLSSLSAPTAINTTGDEPHPGVLANLRSPKTLAHFRPKSIPKMRIKAVADPVLEQFAELAIFSEADRRVIQVSELPRYRRTPWYRNHIYFL